MLPRSTLSMICIILPGLTHSQLVSRVLQRFLRGEQSSDNTAVTAITVCNLFYAFQSRPC